jgi:hypothetical protein
VYIYYHEWLTYCICSTFLLGIASFSFSNTCFDETLREDCWRVAPDTNSLAVVWQWQILTICVVAAWTLDGLQLTSASLRAVACRQYLCATATHQSSPSVDVLFYPIFIFHRSIILWCSSVLGRRTLNRSGQPFSLAKLGGVRQTSSHACGSSGLSYCLEYHHTLLPTKTGLPDTKSVKS